ncbi:MAG TPA: ferritin-like domain-containing protein [Terriglobia bacterium]|nr:ferritin-like domain-containing protein [Terriglobia bacterium]
MAKVKSLKELCLQELEGLYDAEKRIVKALPKMADAASGADLRMALEHHLEQTKGHVQRLEHVFHNIAEKPKGKTCEGIKGIIEEGEDTLGDVDADGVRDAAIIAAAQRVEHYEMAVYGSVRSWMNQLGETSSEALLQQTLDEEKEADKTLSTIATGSANVRAQAARP